MHVGNNKTDNARIKVTLGTLRVTIVALEKSICVHIRSVCL